MKFCDGIDVRMSFSPISVVADIYTNLEKYYCDSASQANSPKREAWWIYERSGLTKFVFV